MKRVLIICAGLQMGGAERVAANICISAPSDEFEFHYLVFEGYDNFYRAEIEAKGGVVHTVAPPSRGYREYAHALGLLIDELDIDVVHSHTMFNSGINLSVARKHDVLVRIAHSHTTRTETRVSAVQKGYEKYMQLLIRRNATNFLACGVQAGEWLFGKSLFNRCGEVIPNGIRTDDYRWNTEKRCQIRHNLGIEKDAFVVGHSGTLSKLKNQEFLIRLLPAVSEKKQSACLVLLGEGSSETLDYLKTVADECGVTDRVYFCGGVDNVGDYLSAFDVFAFPSLREGTPLALLEAQCNGVPCVVSERVPCDAFFSDLITVCNLDDREAWLKALCGAKRENPDDYAIVASNAGFDTNSSMSALYEKYKGRKSSIATVSISFDDARGDNTSVFKDILMPKGIPATLNVTTGYVDRSCPKEMQPSQKPAMTVEDVLWVNGESLFEVALHGDRHLNSIEDICACREKLLSWGVVGNNLGKFGFASPGSGLAVEEYKRTTSKNAKANLAYMRTSLRIVSKRPVRVLCRKAGRVIHWSPFYRIAYADTIMRFREDSVIYSIPVMKDATVKQVKAIVDECIKRRGALTLMFHSVLDDVTDEDNWSWETKKFLELCDYLVEMRETGKLEIKTTLDLFEGLK